MDNARLIALFAAHRTAPLAREPFEHLQARAMKRVRARQEHLLLCAHRPLAYHARILEVFALLVCGFDCVPLVFVQFLFARVHVH